MYSRISLHAPGQSIPVVEGVRLRRHVGLLNCYVIKRGEEVLGTVMPVNADGHWRDGFFAGRVEDGPLARANAGKAGWPVHTDPVDAARALLKH